MCLSAYLSVCAAIVSGVSELTCVPGPSIPQGPRTNHPCIVQWTLFNEGDCWSVFDVPAMVAMAQSLDPTRLLDTDSGGDANNQHLADVNDIHCKSSLVYASIRYPQAVQSGTLGCLDDTESDFRTSSIFGLLRAAYPSPKAPSPIPGKQYAMVGEFGGLGYIMPGKEWVAGGCYAYAKVDDAAGMLNTYVGYLDTLAQNPQVRDTQADQTQRSARFRKGRCTLDRMQRLECGGMLFQ